MAMAVGGTAGRPEEPGQPGEGRFRALVERSRDALVLVAAAGQTLYVSPAGGDLLGYAPAALVGGDAFAGLHPDERARHARGFARLVRRPGATARATVRYRHQDGGWRWLEVAATNLLHDPAVGAVAASYRDVTARVEAEATPQASEARMRLLVEQAPVVLWTTDATLRFASGVGAGLAALGLRPDQLVGTSLAAYFGTADAAFPPLAAHHRALAGAAVTYDQEWAGRVYQSRVEPLRGADGAVVGVVGVAVDVTERRQAEEAARRRAVQAERLAATLAQVGAAPDVAGALEVLLRGAVALLGGAHGVARLFGPGPGERPLELILDATDGADGAGRLTVRVDPPPLGPGTFAAALQAGGPPTLVDDFWSLDPAAYPAHATMRQEGQRAAVNVSIEVGGRCIGSLHVNHPQPGAFGPADLALAGALALQAGATVERARLESAQREHLARLTHQAAELARREAEAAALRELDQLKDELLRTVSHELRTPLTLIVGYTELLRARHPTLGPETVDRLLGRIGAGAGQLTRLVEDLLDAGRLAQGEVALRPEDLDLAPVLRDALEGFRTQAGGARLIGELAAPLPVRADRTRVVQVVENLLANAVKYAPAGPIVLRAQPVAGPAAGPRRVRVEVEDRGPGIAPAEQPRVWERFYRGAAAGGAVPGSGVGLAVVKALVEAQGGQVGLESAPGHGARFWFELPETAVRPAAAPSCRFQR